MNYNKLQILEFKLESMVPHPAIVMVAKRGSGKSWITRDIIYNYRDMPCGAVISPTDRLSSFYKFFFPDIYIHYDINETIFKKMLARQMKIKNKSDNRKHRGLATLDTRCICVMDDCLAAKGTWEKSVTIREILMNGRHYDLTYILTMQTPLGIGPELRLNFDYVFLLKDDSAINLKKLHQNYASVFKTQIAFEQVFLKCTEDYKAMVINNKSISTDLKDKVFWFKANDRKFVFGSKKFRELHKKYYDPNYLVKQAAKMLDGDIYGMKRRGEDICVNLKKM